MPYWQTERDDIEELRNRANGGDLLPSSTMI
jgi:hypothetical protein